MTTKSKIIVAEGLLVFIIIGAAFALHLEGAIPTRGSTASTTIPPKLTAQFTAEALSDPALRHPLFAALARTHGPDWEKNLHPQLRRWLDWQRKVGTHALITGFTGGDPAAVAASPKFIISVTEWDGADLFQLGLPRTFEDKPVEIIQLGFATFADELQTSQ